MRRSESKRRGRLFSRWVHRRSFLEREGVLADLSVRQQELGQVQSEVSSLKTQLRQAQRKAVGVKAG